MAEPVRLYIRRNSDYGRLMWFHNNKPNEVLIGFYGLYEKQPVLQGIFPERQVMSNYLKDLLFEYPQIRPINEKIDHITCHADGTFHIKTLGGREVYRETMKRVEPLGPDTATFLEFIVLTQMPDKYRITTTEPQKPHIFVDHLDNHIFIIEGRFSGANHKELEKEVSGRLGQIGVIIAPGFRLDASTIRGLLFVQALRMSQDTLINRPDGTIILFKFPIGPDKFMIKGFSIG
jgi:hypothetical protein